MPASMTRLFVHYVWGTWQRMPWITPPVREIVERTIIAKCTELGAQVLALNGIEDHLHLLVKVSPTVTIAKLIGEVKGVSSHLVTHRWPDDFFKWQDGYGAFTVAESGVPAVRAYIANQQAHHHATTSCPERGALASPPKDPSP